MTASTPSSGRSASRRAALVLSGVLGVGWLIGTLALAWAAFGETLTFFGELPTEAEKAVAMRYWLWAAGVAAALPVVGLVLAAIARSRVAIGVWLVLLLLGWSLAAWVLYGYRHQLLPDPPPAQVTVCQEHSGGDTRCPGG